MTEHAQILTRSYIRRSRSRYRAVHQRQMEAMLRRTAWFLGTSSAAAPSATTTTTVAVASTAPQLLVTSPGVPCAPTSTLSLLEIGTPLNFGVKLEEKQKSHEQTTQPLKETDAPFYLSPLPRVSVTSVRSAPTCQASPFTTCHNDSDEEEDDEGVGDGDAEEGIFVLEGQSGDISQPE